MGARRISRRTTLKAAGAVVVGLPLLEIMEGDVEAQTGDAPKRFIALFSSNGFLPHLWAQPDMSGGFRAGPILEPLAEHLDDLIVLRGLRSNSAGRGHGGHRFGAQKFLTGAALAGTNDEDNYANGPSIDQLIADRIGATTPFRSLELGVQIKDGPHHRMVYTGPEAAVAPTSDPAQVFDRVFSDFAAPEGQMEDLRARRRSILDLVGEQFADIDRVASHADRIRLDQHRESIRTIERALIPDATNLRSCSAPTRFTLDSTLDENIPAVIDAHIDLMAYAMSCDMTRVATLMFGPNTGYIKHPFVPLAAEVRGGQWHYFAHHGSEEALAQLEAFYAGKVARLVERLKSFGEASGSVFDQTMILWGSELGRGNHGRDSEGRNDRSYLIAGDAGGAFTTGRFYDLEGPEQTFANRMLLSILHAYGIETDTIGYARACEGGALDLGGA